jgi:hypothetical protein
MAERASTFQTVQIAKEAGGWGVNTAAVKKIQSVEITPAIKSAVQVFTPRGMKVATIAALGKEWVEAKVSGFAAYNDLFYLLSAIMTPGTPTQGGATAAYATTYSINPVAPDAALSYSVEVGDPSTWSSGIIASEFSGAMLTDLTLDFTREAVKVDGTLLGKGFADLGATMTTVTRVVPVQPVLPTEVTISWATTQAGLPGTSLLRVLGANFKIANKVGPLWVVNAATTGCVATIEQKPEMTLTLLLEADTLGMGPLAYLRNGASMFVRIEALGPIIATTYHYTLTLDGAYKVTNVSEFKDQDGVYALEYTLSATYDPMWLNCVQAGITCVETAF